MLELINSLDYFDDGKSLNFFNLRKGSFMGVPDEIKRKVETFQNKIGQLKSLHYNKTQVYSNRKVSHNIDMQIGLHVYQLYGLTEEEIKIVKQS